MVDLSSRGDGLMSSRECFSVGQELRLRWRRAPQLVERSRELMRVCETSGGVGSTKKSLTTFFDTARETVSMAGIAMSVRACARSISVGFSVVSRSLQLNPRLSRLGQRSRRVTSSAKRGGTSES